MSLMSTLAKVAIGVAVAKGAQSMMKGGGSGGGLGGMLGELTKGMPGATSSGGTRGASTGGGLEDVLGSILGGSKGGSAGGGLPGGLGGLLESLGGAGGGGAGGGLQDILGNLAGAAGTGGLLGGLQKAIEQRPERNDKSFGEVLNSQFDATPQPAVEPSAEQEATAALMLRAMIQAAKCDGTLDAAEREKLLGRLGDDVDDDEAAFVQAQLKAPVDVAGLIRDVPKGMGPQVYTMSVLGINLDNQAEAQYLHQLAQGLGIQPKQVNEIHARMGVPSLYT